jgi:hypothetical protein
MASQANRLVSARWGSNPPGVLELSACSRGDGLGVIEEVPEVGERGADPTSPDPHAATKKARAVRSQVGPERTVR